MNEVKRISLSPSVYLNVIPSEKFKLSFLSICFLRRIDEKDAAMNALLPEVITRSCRKYPTMLSLSSVLDSLYGTSIDGMNTMLGETHVFGISASFPDNRYAFDDTDIISEVISILSELILHPLTNGNAFDCSVVESEKEKLCGRIEARINNPAGHALRRCEEIMCENERYSISHLGTKQSVALITPEALYKYYKSLPGKTEVDIYYAGNADIEMLAKRFSEIFSAFDRRLEADLTTEVIRSACGEVKTVIEDMNVAQGKLVIGFRSGFCLSDDDYHVFSLLNCLLGASPTSKLFMNVREKMSLCYYCSSRQNSLKGLLTVSSGIEVNDFEKARDAILKQIEAIRSGEISDEELESARKALINYCNELCDSQSSLVSWYLMRSIAGLNDTPKMLCQKLRTVTKEDIISAAQRLSLDTVYFLRGTQISNSAKGGEQE